MSLGIIVTPLACIVQRLASSMRPTIYASEASCRHKIVLLWKCKSYLPTSRAIWWTNCKKESFQIRSSVLFWNCQISSRATVPSQYFSLLHLSSLEEFLLGGFGSNNRLELPPGCLLLTQCRWPNLHGHLGQLSGWQQ